MDREVFTEGELGKFFNDSLICFKMDANSKESKPVCAKYKINGFPTFLYFSPEGNLCYKSSGYMDVRDLMKDAHLGLMETRDKKPLATWENEYPAKKTDAGFMYDYAVKRMHSGLPNGKQIDEYLTLLPPAERYSKKNLRLIRDNAETLSAPGIAYEVVLTCRDTLLSRYSATDADEILDFLFMQYSMGILEAAVESRDEKMLELVISLASNIRNPEFKGPGYDLEIRKTYYGQTGDYIRLAETTEQFIDTWILPDGGKTLSRDTLSTLLSLNKACSVFFYYVTEKPRLNKALSWNQRSLELAASSEMYRPDLYLPALDLKANLLYKTGEVEQALKLKAEILASIPESETDEVERVKAEMAAMENREKTWE